ncbi:hypothetical protein GJU93_06015 [Brucella sp. 10RB9212]|uniref:hypothetical protein n=1 Tax=unclassified Brucella TaxID=2632610 RepID=UPI0012AD28C4|nr:MULTISPECIES: hypothetical protein [unclassified Brucella]MRN46146.1 hypothetical protein [Brucella sp. 10RB9212]
MTERLTILHSEKRTEAPKSLENIRVVLQHEDNSRISVATMAADTSLATAEVTFHLSESVWIAERIIAGDMRVATRPGLARILAGAVVALAKIGCAAGALEEVTDVEEVSDDKQSD